ncbi:MAG: hypothetical protein K1X75_04020 [Leptospirales bacterium]|nr:hypothetical protein [Leptospirales bacterium]
MKSVKSLLLALLTLLTVGCQKLLGGSDGQSWTEALLALGAAASAQVTPVGGGTLSAPSMTLTVPQGAVDEDVVISYSLISVPAQQGETLPVQAAYRFEPEGLQFNKPATLTICYNGDQVVARGLQERTLQVQYYDQDAGQYISMGGDVASGQDCVSAPIYHFSAYILTAQLLATTDAPPTIGGASFFPGTPIAGMPLKVRSSVTDWNPASGIATVRFYYRTAGSGAPWKSVAMTPDAEDGTGDGRQRAGRGARRGAGEWRS